MDTKNLLLAILTPVVAFLLKWALTAIGVEIDEELFNTIVAAIVTAFLALVGYDAAHKVKPTLFKG